MKIKSSRTPRWPGYIFGGLGGVMFAVGAGLMIDRLITLQTWTEVEGRVIESRVQAAGSQHVAVIRVEFDFRGRKIRVEPASDYRSNNYGWIAAAVDRHPVGARVTLLRSAGDPPRTRLDAGFNFNTFGLPGLLAAIGLTFAGVGLLALRSARLGDAEQDARTRADSANLKRAQYLGVAAFVGLIGLAMASAGGALLPPALAKRQWPELTARADGTDIFTRTSSSSGKYGPQTFHVGRLYVRYEVAGKAYRSAMELRGSSTEREKVERMLARIVPGEPRAVRVDPADPHQIIPADAWPLVLPTVFLLVGVGVVGIAVLIARSAPRRVSAFAAVEEKEDGRRRRG